MRSGLSCGTTDHPIEPTLHHVVTSGTQPLSVVIEIVGNPKKPFQTVAAPKPSGAWEQPLPPLEAGKAVAIPFAPRLEEMTSVEHRSLLKVESDLGTIHWLPVTSRREDLEE